jgi:hypothetical protein
MRLQNYKNLTEITLEQNLILKKYDTRPIKRYKKSFGGFEEVSLTMIISKNLSKVKKKLHKHLIFGTTQKKPKKS